MWAQLKNDTVIEGGEQQQRERDGDDPQTRGEERGDEGRSRNRAVRHSPTDATPYPMEMIGKVGAWTPKYEMP